MKTFFIAILFATSALAENPASVENKTPAEGKPAVEEKTSVEAKASVETATTPEPKLEPYKLKNRSSFTLSREARAPFWPIGWNKSKSTDPYQPRVASTGVLTAKKKFEIQPQHFSVTSVLYQLSYNIGITVTEEVFAPASSQPRPIRENARCASDQKPSSHEVMTARSSSRLSKARLQSTSLI